jgi:hypothetical protein
MGDTAIHDVDVKKPAAMSGWGSEFVGDEACGYAWYNHDAREWYHAPPRVTQPDRMRRLTMTVDKVADGESKDVIYARGIQGSRSSCQGDSGSPLVQR